MQEEEKKLVGVSKKLGCSLILLLLMLVSYSEPKLCVEAAEAHKRGSGEYYDELRRGGGDYARSPSFKVSSYNKFKGGGGRGFQYNGDPDQVLGDGKRRVITGPNPLHNR